MLHVMIILLSHCVLRDPKSHGQEKGMIEDEMAGWHHRLDGHEFE